MKLTSIILFSLLLVLGLQGCLESAISDPNAPSVYGRQSIQITYQDIWWDSIYQRASWVSSFRLLDSNDKGWPSSTETVWNCNQLEVARHGDTVLLKSFTYTPPDSHYVIQFHCLDTYDRFLLQADGHAIPLDSLTHNPHVRISGDSLLFEQTLIFLERGDDTPSEEDATIRYPQYGLLDTSKVDSLQKELQDNQPRPRPNRVGGPMYRVAWQTWVYLAK